MVLKTFQREARRGTRLRCFTSADGCIVFLSDSVFVCLSLAPHSASLLSLCCLASAALDCLSLDSLAPHWGRCLVQDCVAFHSDSVPCLVQDCVAQATPSATLAALRFSLVALAAALACEPFFHAFRQVRLSLRYFQDFLRRRTASG